MSAHDADPERDALLAWMLHASGRPALLASAWERLLMVPLMPAMPAITTQLSSTAPQIPGYVRQRIDEVYARVGGNLNRTAVETGLSRETLRKYGYRGRTRGRPRALELPT
jgi:hypothetical protein